MSDQTRFLLNETDLPKAWYNINADSPVPPAPVLHPATKEPVTPDFLSVLFPMELIMQEVSTDRYIDIPEEVREIYKLYRPTPLIRARRLEKALGTPAHIYFKNESGSHAAYRTEPGQHVRRRGGGRRNAGGVDGKFRQPRPGRGDRPFQQGAQPAQQE